MQNCPRQLVMQSCVLCSFVRCGSSNQIEEEVEKNKSPSDGVKVVVLERDDEIDTIVEVEEHVLTLHDDNVGSKSKEQSTSLEIEKNKSPDGVKDVVLERDCKFLKPTDLTNYGL